MRTPPRALLPDKRARGPSVQAAWPTAPPNTAPIPGKPVLPGGTGHNPEAETTAANSAHASSRTRSSSSAPAYASKSRADPTPTAASNASNSPASKTADDRLRPPADRQDDRPPTRPRPEHPHRPESRLGGGPPKGRPPPSASSQQAAWARGFSAAGQAWGALRTLILAGSLSSRRRRDTLAGPSGGSGDGADSVGACTLEPLVTVLAVTNGCSRKVARNVLR